MAKMSSFEIPFNELQKCADQGSYIMEEIYKRGGNVKASWTMEPGIPSSNVKINFELLPGAAPTESKLVAKPFKSANERIEFLIATIAQLQSDKLLGYCPPDQKYREKINCEITACSRCKHDYIAALITDLRSQFLFQEGEEVK